MSTQPHALRVARITDTIIDPTTGTAHISEPRFQPRCTCGWVGDEMADRGVARDRATLHGRNAALAGLLP